LILTAFKECGDPVRGTGVMLSKAVCAALFVAMPSLLGYPALLNVDRRVKSSPSTESVDVEIWPVSTTMVVSPQPRWVIIETPAGKLSALDGDVLSRELQRELRRVGCYNGDISGSWTPETQRAMQTFTNRVNATLPLEEPNRVLLALLQSHPDKTCSNPCPSGENPSTDGRCVPSVAGISVKISALTSRKAQPRITSWSATETASLEDNIPNLPPAMISRAPGVAAPVKPSPAPKLFAAPPKPVPQRPTVANREHSRSLPRSDQPRMSQRPEREASRSTQSTEFARSLFQRIDNSLR
jgi:hypothetical protein